MRKIAIVIALFFICLIIPAVSYAMKLNVDPARVEATMKAGSEKTGAITVLNYDEEKPIRVKAYMKDLVYLPDGSNDFVPIGSTPWSVRDWIKIGPTEFEIPAGKQETVRYMISVPKDAKGGRYGILFFETVPAPSEIKQVGATVNFRLGTVVLLTVEGTGTVNAKLTGLIVKGPEKDKPLEILWTVNNGGNVIARPFGTAKIIDETKKEIAKIDLNKLKEGVFPGTARTFSTKYSEKIPGGNYYVQVVLDYGGNVLLGGQSKFTIE